jgi:TIR domain
VISYARADRRLVRVLVAFLRAGLSTGGAVFWDADFVAGRDWLSQFKRKVDRSSDVYVFWCWHASRSKAVAEEIGYAFAKGKKVFPVLIDSTPLEARLAPIHAVDMRGELRHSRGVSTKRTYKATGRRKVAARKAVPWYQPPKRGRFDPFTNSQSAEKILAAFRPFVEASLRRK